MRQRSGRSKSRQAVVVNGLHQGEQAAQFVLGEAFAGKPVQVVDRQVGQELTGVFAMGHGCAHQL